MDFSMKRICTALALAGLAASLSGCVIAMGNRDGWPTKVSPPTLGQQLSDLKKARDLGALSEDEYQAEKKRLLEGRGRK
jgi:hypothetical protein